MPIKSKLDLIITLACCLILESSCKCSDQCNACDKGNTCYSCIEGYFLSNDKDCIKCPSFCRICQSQYMCNDCQSNYWNLASQCDKKCPSNCYSNCDHSTGLCFSCKSNFYGDDCAQDCQLCRSGNCNNQGCTSGCYDGYFQDNYHGYSVCRLCSTNCSKCGSFYLCTECQPYFYVYTYFTSTERRSDCKSCSPGCASCIDLDRCLSCQHINYCKECKYNGTAYTCSVCENGWYVENGQCSAEIQHCPVGCLNGCDISGACYQCRDGFTGRICNDSCTDLCLRCSKESPYICEQCKNPDLLTPMCTEHCSGNCLKINGKSTCQLDNGNCLNGCMTGKWGTKCENNCSINCMQNAHSQPECNESNGTCLYGCISGFTGSTCESVVTANVLENTSVITPQSTLHEDTTQSVGQQQSHPEDANSSSNTALGAGIGGGVAVVIIITVIITVILLKRRRMKKDEHHGASLSTSDSAAITYDMHAKPATTLSHDDESYVYAQPNKLKHPQKVSGNINGPIATPYNTIAIDLDAETDDDTSKDGSVKLEDIDDGEAVIIISESEMPTSDIYYNTAGLLRSRIQVSKLSDYLQDKSDIETEFKNLPTGLTRTCNEALKPFNRGKNRYNGIYAYDATRVVLRSKDYINACYIEGHDGSSRAYVACLGPTKSTMNQFATFWEMVWQENTQKIVMLTNLVEAEKMKCEQYWPDDGSLRQYGDIAVTTTSESVYAEFVVRELNVVKKGESKSVSHYHYTAWPDKSVPDTVVSLLEFRDVVEKHQVQRAGPTVVHCSAGIGRTGTYISLDILIKEGMVEQSVDIFGCVMALRGQRTNMVQNVEQYRYLHHCVVYALTSNPQPLNADPLTSSYEQAEDQFQALEKIPLLPDKDALAVGANKRRKENRKGADIPGDLHRVKLKQTKKDYINAVYMNTYRHESRFILAQTPMPNTVDDFVTLIYQEGAEKIVCLDAENLTDKSVAQYFPTDNRVSKFGHFQLVCVKHEAHDSYVQREITLSKQGSMPSNEKKIMHYQYRGWSTEDNIPTRQTDFLQFLNTVNNKSGHGRDTILVHCLDGAKKSGLLCAVAIMLEKLSVEKEVSVINTICQVRGRRRSALQNYEQFKFCYTCIREHLETSEAKTYYNIL